MLDKTIQDQIDALFHDYDNSSTPGCALGVVQNETLVYSGGFGMADLEKQIPINAATVFHLASVSKQFTATCIALLEEAGEISLGDNVKRYVPFLPDYGHELKLRHLVYMTNGLEDFYDVTSLIMGIPEGNYFSWQDAINIIQAADWLKFPPGEQWSYGNTGYFLLACIIEKVSGQPFAGFVQEQVFKPLGMRNTFVRTDRHAAIPQRANGYAKFPNKNGNDPSGAGFAYRLQNEMIEFGGAGQAWSTVNDLVLWEQNFYDNRLGKKDPRLIKKMTEPGKLNDGTHTHYAYGQFVTMRGSLKVVFHEGGATGVNTVLYRIPQKRLSVICLANTSDFLTVMLRKLGEECYERIAGIVSPWEPVEPGPSRTAEEQPQGDKVTVAQALPPLSELETLAGSYEDPGSSHIWEVSLEGSKVNVNENYAKRFSLIFEKPSDLPELSFHSLEPKLRGYFCREAGADHGPFTEIHVGEGNSSRVFQRYQDLPVNFSTLHEYEGLYTCHSLKTSYRVSSVASGVHLENLNPQNDLLNVLFTPTIRDMFIARYPPLIGWYVVHFQRDPGGQVAAFSFRDEVAGREKWVFEKQG